MYIKLLNKHFLKETIDGTIDEIDKNEEALSIID